MHLPPHRVHGDFGASNILYHPERGAITGVIDFGSARPDDPAVDFAALSTLDPLFLDYCAAIYPEIRRAEARVAFYRGTFALQEALFGAENGDDDALSAGLEEYI